MTKKNTQPRVKGRFVPASSTLPANPETEVESEEFEDLMSDPGTPSMSMEEQVAQLTALVTRLAARIDAGDAVPPPMDPPVTVPPQPPFTPPATTQLGASPSLRSLFPEIEAAHITAIITHEFRGADLWKLDSRYRDKEPAFAFNSTTGQFETSNRAAKDYKSFNSLYIPLVTYFNVLSAHIPPSPARRSVPFVFFHFLTHLQKIAAEYEWAAVLEYTMVFFNRRRMEMLEFGDYSKWAVPDTGLMAEHVFGNKKVIAKAGSSPKNSPSPSRTPPASNSATTCQNFNSGKCLGQKCPFNRMHVCSSCGKSDHSLLEHPKGT
jgi:hypothetical protein